MREIKFRCWHNLGIAEWNEKRTKVISYKACMFYDEKPGDCLRWKNDGQDIEAIMQFTGLHDKNGKEIFEGDLLLNPKATGKDVIPRKVVWADMAMANGWSAPFIRSHWAWNYSNVSLGTVADNCEIIGNIYENPELIKEDK